LQLRRGAERAEIYSIAFSANLHWLAVSSDKGTVHVFGLKPTTEETRSEAMTAAASPSSNGMALASGGSGGYLLGGPSSLLSFAASNAGSSLAFMKGNFSLDELEGFPIGGRTSSLNWMHLLFALVRM
jgi:hypothetical protein